MPTVIKSRCHERCTVIIKMSKCVPDLERLTVHPVTEPVYLNIWSFQTAYI